MDLITELTIIHRQCRNLIENRNHVEFNAYADIFLKEEDGIPKLNKLKTILVITKNVPSFFPEIKEKRIEILEVYNRLFKEID